MITMIIVTTSTTNVTKTTTTLMNMKIVLGAYIRSSGITHTSIGIARLRGTGRLIGTGATTILMPYLG